MEQKKRVYTFGNGKATIMPTCESNYNTSVPINSTPTKQLESKQ